MENSLETTSIDLLPFQLHGVQPVLSVRDIEESVAWYRDVLGFTVDFVWGDPPEHARVLAVDYSTHVAIQLTRGLIDTPDPRQDGWIMIHVGDRIEELYEEYVARGVKVLRTLDTRPWGLKDFDIFDCNGHILRFGAEA